MGEIRVAGRPVRGPETNIGMVFQSHVLVDWRTVLGNVLLQIDLRGLRRRDYVGWRRSALATSPSATRTSCPAACSSGPRSAGR